MVKSSAAAAGWSCLLVLTYLACGRPSPWKTSNDSCQGREGVQGIIPWLLIHTCLHNLWPALPVLMLQSASEHVLYFVTVFFIFTVLRVSNIIILWKYNWRKSKAFFFGRGKWRGGGGDIIGIRRVVLNFFFVSFFFLSGGWMVVLSLLLLILFYIRSWVFSVQFCP